MELNSFSCYVVIINIIGFLLYLTGIRLYRNAFSGQMNVVLAILSLLGGSLGIVFSILIFDRKAEKRNMMSRIFVSCILVIQIILFLMLKGHLSDHITLAFWAFFHQHKILTAYLIIINLVTFAAFAADKIAAIKQKPRIRIVTLLALAFAGGSIGGLTAMYLLRHKTRKAYFTVGVPLIMVMQIVILFYAMNVAW